MKTKILTIIVAELTLLCLSNAAQAGRSAPSKLKDSTPSQTVVDEVMAEDLTEAEVEYLYEFLADTYFFPPHEDVERVVIKGRKESMPQRNNDVKAMWWESFSILVWRGGW